MPKKISSKNDNIKKKSNVSSKSVSKNVKAKKKNVKKKTINDSTPIFEFGIMDFFIIAVVISLVSCIGTGLILNYQYKKNVMYDSKLVSDDNLNEFIRTYLEIVDNYYEEVDRKGIISAATSSMVSYLKDNYSIYLDGDAVDDFNDSLESSYDGMGIVVAGNYVYFVYEGSPAEKAGLQSGDIIIEVNDNEITEDNVDELSNEESTYSNCCYQSCRKR